MKQAAARAQELPMPSDPAAVGTWIRMLKAHNLIFRETRRGLAPYCTMTQFDVIAQLMREKNGTTSAELSRRLLVTAGNLTGVLDRMVKSGLVRRNPDKQDRRVTRVSLTDKGKELAKTAIPIHTRDIQTLFGALSAVELRQIRLLLDKLIAGVE
jgi:DNA-binding MarR family transcriptional regulator